MLKSFLISLRRKPKVVRDQAAMWFAGIFTFVVFGFWVFSLPGQFAGFSGEQTGEIISTLKEDIRTDVPNVSEIKELPDEIRKLSASTSEEEEVIIPNEYPTTTPTTDTPIRLATTTPSTTGNTQNSQ